MMDDYDKEEELAVLSELFLSNDMDSDQAKRFHELVRNEPALLRDVYHDAMIDFLLAQRPGKGFYDENFSSKKDPAPPVPDSLNLDELTRLAAKSRSLPTSRPRPAATVVPPAPGSEAGRSLLPMKWVVPILLLLYGVLVFYEWYPARKDGSEGPLVQQRSLAVITCTDDVRWTDPEKRPGLGEPLSSGSLRFESGSIELLFFNGVSAVVEGPAELVLLDRKRVFCRQGTWSVTVPPQGKGFEIQTSNLTIRDLGTRFFAGIEKDRCTVHVVEGTVETEHGRGEKTVFKTGSGAAYLGDDLVERLSGAVKGFVTENEMRRRSDRFWSVRGLLEPSSDIAEKALFSLDFDTPKNFEAVGGRMEQGRTPDGKAFRFFDRGDRIGLSVPGRYESLTAIARIRVDRLHEGMNPILTSEGTDSGGFLWHLTGDGALGLGIYTQRDRSTERFESPIVLTEKNSDRWISTAFVIDGPRQTVTLLLDGLPVYSDHLSRKTMLRSDRLNIGNWRPKKDSPDMFRALDGAVEELSLYDFPMDFHEIRNLQRAGDEAQRSPRTNFQAKGEQP